MCFYDCESLLLSFCTKNVWAKTVIFGYLQNSQKLQKWGPTKHSSIFHGVGSTASTDQRECVFMIVGLFVCPFVPKMCGRKMCDFWLFCTGPDLRNQKIGSDEALICFPWG